MVELGVYLTQKTKGERKSLLKRVFKINKPRENERIGRFYTHCTEAFDSILERVMPHQRFTLLPGLSLRKRG